MSGPQQLELAQIDLRFSSLRVPVPHELRKLQACVRSEGRIRDPVLVSVGVEEKHWVLVDGFKRLRVAEDLGLTRVWAQVVQLDAAHAKVAILQCNQARPGLSEIEEAWIVHSLCREHNLLQLKVAEMLGRHKSWVCRRLQLAEVLEPGLQENVRLGLLSTTAATVLSQLQRCNQLRAAQAVVDHQLSSRQCAQLVRRLKEIGDPQAMQEVLEDPLRYLGDLGALGAKGARDSDPRLSEDGNRLLRELLSWQNACGHLARELRCHPAAVEAHLLVPELQDALHAARRAMRQLEAMHSRCSAQLLATQSELAAAQGAAHA